MELGIVIALLIFFIGIFIGLEVCWVFLASAFVGAALTGTGTFFIPGTFYHTVNNYIMMAICFFILAGGLMSSAGLADHILKFSYSLMGNIRGGMIAVGIIASVFLGALTGSSVPVIAALIPMLVPKLEKLGYQKRYTTAVLCSSSFLGYLIPPSVPVLVYCLIANQSVAAVFLSTVVPGLLLALGYMIVNYFICQNYMDDKHNDLDNDLNLSYNNKLKKIFSTGRHALPALGCPFVVLVGIYGGIFTPNEAGAIAVIYTLLVGIFVYKRLNMKNIWISTKESLISIGMIVILMAVGTVFARFLVRIGAAQSFAAVFLNVSNEKNVVLLLVNILLLTLGMFVNSTVVEIITVPLIFPLLIQLGVNPVQLGAIVVMNVGLGVVTPPYALSIFAGSRLSGVPYEKLVGPMLIYLFSVGIPVLLLTTYIPAISCWLPQLILGSKIVGSW